MYYFRFFRNPLALVSSLLGLCLSGLLFAAQPDELLPIPAFVMPSGSYLPSLNEQMAPYHLYGITVHDYRFGLINAPDKTIAVIMVTPHETCALVSNNDNFNLPQYHDDYDPVEPVKASSLRGVSLSIWSNEHLDKGDVFISDGDPLTITIPEAKLPKLFIYAPAEQMVVQTPTSFPFYGPKTPYLTKQDRWAFKRVPLHGLHETFDGVGSNQKVQTLIAQMKAHRVDTCVIDFKSYFYLILNRYNDFNSFMNVPDNQLVSSSAQLANVIAQFHAAGLKVSLRMVIAMDYWAERMNSNMLLWNKQTNQAWRDHNSQRWIDMFSPDTLAYYSKLTRIACLVKGDDIQFDYIRFPTEGHIELAYSRYVPESRAHHKSVNNLLRAASRIANSYNVSFSSDIFGIVVWENMKTNAQLGQNILTFMRYADTLCPMIYPSHFHDGFEGIPKPGDAPYLFNKKGSDRFKALMDRYPYYKVLGNPWIQAFQYKAPSYSPTYVREELRALKDAGMSGYNAWNAANNYNIFFRGLE